MIELDNTDYNVARSEPLVLDLYSPTCGPCSVLMPTLEDLESEYTGRLVFGRLDVSKYPDVASELGVRGIPTVMIIRDTQVLGRLTGIHPVGTYRDLFDTVL